MDQSVKQALMIAGGVLALTIVGLFGARVLSPVPTTSEPRAALSTGAARGPMEGQPMTAPAPYLDQAR